MPACTGFKGAFSKSSAYSSILWLLADLCLMPKAPRYALILAGLHCTRLSMEIARDVHCDRILWWVETVELDERKTRANDLRSASGPHFTRAVTSGLQRPHKTCTIELRVRQASLVIGLPISTDHDFAYRLCCRHQRCIVNLTIASHRLHAARMLTFKLRC